MSTDSRDWPSWTKELSSGLRNLRTGAPSAMYASHALEAFTQFTNAKAAA